MKHNKIALIGMMGCGKSTISKLLAQKLKLEVYELDEIFEKEENIKIKDFFLKFGEKEFRKKESEILNTISKKEDFVLSCGGGVVLEEENRKILFGSDIITIYLKTSTEEIYQRIKNSNNRPLLMVENPKKEIEKIIKSREKYYNLATLKIETDNKNPQKITEEILKKYGKNSYIYK